MPACQLTVGLGAALMSTQLSADHIHWAAVMATKTWTRSFWLNPAGRAHRRH